jgi:protein SCO1/2
MMRIVVFSLLFVSSIVLSACSGEAGAADNHVHHFSQVAPPGGMEQKSLVVLSDQPMLDQDGNLRRLKSEVAGGKIVVVDFIFTSCQTICPVTTALLSESHKRLADLPADSVSFVSMSIDSAVDTPERLKAFSGRHGATWTFLTGEKRVMDEALVWLNAYSTNPEDHAAMILIGDAATGEFSRVYGLPDPSFVEARVRDLLARRADGGTHTF